MMGAIIGDIIGSRFEFHSIKTKDFELFGEACIYTDDTVLTIAVAHAILKKSDLSKTLRDFTNKYITSYGIDYWYWSQDPKMGPYGSYGNGASMRVSSTAWFGMDIKDVEKLATWSASVTHNHPEGIRGAKATAIATRLALEGYGAEEIRKIIERTSQYDLSKNVDEIRETAIFEVKSEISVPQAIICALEAKSYEDAIRNAVSLGGDADTQSAIAGSIAEGLFGIPDWIKEKALAILPVSIREDTNYIINRCPIEIQKSSKEKLNELSVWSTNEIKEYQKYDEYENRKIKAFLESKNIRTS